jgi:SAM-dependent methyltransferase
LDDIARPDTRNSQRDRTPEQQAAIDVWSSSPAGTTASGGAEPGTREFFERGLARRSTEEMPWLRNVVPFSRFRDRDVLEVGCGVGFDAYEFVRNGSRYVGVDLTPANIDRTKRHLAYFDLAADVRVAAAEHLPFEAASFDVVYSNGVLHHLEIPQRGFDEVARVLRPGGEAWIIVYHKNSVFYWLTLFLFRWILHGEFRHYRSFIDRLAAIEHTTSDARPVVHAYTKKGLRQSLQRAGFNRVTIKVRKLTVDDLPPIGPAGRIWYHVPQSMLDRIGRRFGWYLIAHAGKRS